MRTGFKPWDVVVDNQEYEIIVYEDGYFSGEYYKVFQDNHEDSIDFNSDTFVCWGIKYVPQNCIGEDILGNRCVNLDSKITITRNGKDFYSFEGDMYFGIDRARVIINDLNKHSFKFNNRDYERYILGTYVMYFDAEYVVKKWFQSELEVEIENTFSGKTKRISIFDKRAMWGCRKKTQEEKKHCYVYYIINEARNKIKIGISNDPISRAKNIQTSSGEEIEILNIIEFDSRNEALETEEFLHKRFENFRMRPTKVSTSSEWFDIKIKDALLTCYKTKEQIMEFINAMSEKGR